MFHNKNKKKLEAGQNSFKAAESRFGTVWSESLLYWNRSERIFTATIACSQARKHSALATFTSRHNDYIGPCVKWSHLSILYTLATANEADTRSSSSWNYDFYLVFARNLIQVFLTSTKKELDFWVSLWLQRWRKDFCEYTNWFRSIFVFYCNCIVDWFIFIWEVYVFTVDHVLIWAIWATWYVVLKQRLQCFYLEPWSSFSML